MPVLNYGQTAIEWYFQLDSKLKRHYVTVERGRPVLLRGPLVDEPEQEALVLRRARWIREKLAQVNQPLASEPIVTGSRLRYAGRTYFTEVRHTPDILKPRLTFTASRFIVDNPDGASILPDVLMPLLERFYRDRAHEKLLVRVRHWQRETGLQATGARIRHFQSRWASCDASNTALRMGLMNNGRCCKSRAAGDSTGAKSPNLASRSFLSRPSMSAKSESFDTRT